MDIITKACSLTATGFFFLPSICIALFNSSHYKASRGFRRGPSFCTTDMGLHCTICTNSNFSDHFHFLQIRLDSSNFHIFPPCFIQLKQKIDRSSGHEGKHTLQFLHFSQQYTIYILARRGKNKAGFFSCTRMRLTSSPFSPANMCIYIIWSRGTNDRAAQMARGSSNRPWVYLA